REPADDGAGEVLRYRRAPEAGGSLQLDLQPTARIVPLPDWLTRNVKADSPRPQSLTPSHALDELPMAAAGGNAEQRERALKRGIAMHRLMQSLPDIPSERRLDAAQRYLARQQDFSDGERDAIAVQVLAVLDDPRFAALFALGSRAEVPIVGRLDGRPVAGIVDRLVVTPDAVMIADYKTNRPAPRS